MLRIVGYFWSRHRRTHRSGRCENLVVDALRRVRHLVEEMIVYPYRLGFQRFDREDEHRARRMRESLGARKCLVSWESQQDRLWKARLSGPGIVVTIERTAKSRASAILRSERAMSRILTSRPDANPPPTPDADAHS